jgi:hypothetical protein
MFRAVLGAAVFTFLFSLSVIARPVSRVELTDGTVYEHAEVEVDNIYKVLTIQSGGDQRSVSFTEVQLILDVEGRDITPEVLGKHYGVAQQPQTDEQSPSNEFEDEFDRQRRPRRWPLNGGFVAYGNFSLPTGSWYDGIIPSFGFGFDGFVAVGKRFALRASVSKAGTGVDVDELFDNVEVLSNDLSSSVWRYFLSFQYHNWPAWQEGGRMVYYLFSGVGVVSHKMSGSALINDPQSGQLLILYGDESSTSKFSTTYGFGAIAMISPNLGINFAANLDVLFIGSVENPDSIYGSDVQTAGIIDVRIGLTYLFRTHKQSSDTGLNPGR